MDVKRNLCKRQFIDRDAQAITPVWIEPVPNGQVFKDGQVIGMRYGRTRAVYLGDRMIGRLLPADHF